MGSRGEEQAMYGKMARDVTRSEEKIYPRESGKSERLKLAIHAERKAWRSGVAPHNQLHSRHNTKFDLDVNLDAQVCTETLTFHTKRHYQRDGITVGTARARAGVQHDRL